MLCFFPDNFLDEHFDNDISLYDNMNEFFLYNDYNDEDLFNFKEENINFNINMEKKQIQNNNSQLFTFKVEEANPTQQSQPETQVKDTELASTNDSTDISSFKPNDDIYSIKIIQEENKENNDNSKKINDRNRKIKNEIYLEDKNNETINPNNILYKKHTKIGTDILFDKINDNIFNCYIRDLIKKNSINKNIELKKISKNNLMLIHLKKGLKNY